MLKHKAKFWVVMASLMGALLFSPAIVPLEGTALAATAKETNAARQVIQAANKKMEAAYARKDLEGSFSVFAKDFVGILPNGIRMNLQTFKNQTKMMFDAAQSLKTQNVIQKFTLKGNTATVLNTVSSTIIMRAPANQKKSVIKSTERTNDTWVKRNGKWLVTQSKVLSHHTTINGKAVKM